MFKIEMTALRTLIVTFDSTLFQYCLLKRFNCSGQKTT